MTMYIVRLLKIKKWKPYLYLLNDSVMISTVGEIILFVLKFIGHLIGCFGGGLFAKEELLNKCI